MNGTLEGEGREYYRNSSLKFCGLFEKGSYAVGDYYFEKNGHRYKYAGWFDNGVVHDLDGKIYAPSGNLIYRGEVSDLVRSGQGVEYFDSKAEEWKYRGGFKDDKYSGEGTLRAEDPVTHSLYIRFKKQDFSEGFVKKGIELYPDGNTCYDGQFENGLPSGYGT